MRDRDPYKLSRSNIAISALVCEIMKSRTLGVDAKRCLGILVQISREVYG